MITALSFSKNAQRVFSDHYRDMFPSVILELRLICLFRWYFLKFSCLSFFFFFLGVTETSCPLAQKLPRRGECFLFIRNLYWQSERQTFSSTAFKQCILKKPFDICWPLSPPLFPLFSIFHLKSYFLLPHFSPPSPSLSPCHYLISPLSSLPPFFALLLIFCPTHEVLLPEGVFKLHPAKKRHHKTPALASHYSPNAISSDFVCMIRWGNLLFFFICGESWGLVLFNVFSTFTFKLMSDPWYSCTLTY